MSDSMSRRQFLTASAGALGVAGMLLADTATQPVSHAGKAHIAITLDLEMARNFPTWEQTHWDYEKGNLDADSKKYSVEAAQLVKKHDGRIHFFVVGQV